VVSRQLAAWGSAPTGEGRPRVARLERDLERVLEDLADDFPLLQSLVDRRAGGQKRLPMAGRGTERVAAPLFADMPVGEEQVGGGSGSPPDPQPMPAADPEPQPDAPEPDGDAGAAREPPTDTSPRPDAAAHPDRVAAAGTIERVAGRRRAARYGLLVQFEARPDDLELARLVDSTVWINDAHPAYIRALASRSVGYHTALAVALALASLAVEPAEEHAFITQFLAHWGGAPAAGRRSGRSKGQRKDGRSDLR
jgi:hypothetical protein